MTNQTTEIQGKAGLKSLLEGLDKQQLTAFCSYLGLHGASFYTMVNKLVRGAGTFDLWEEKGVEGMIREFDPCYKGDAKDFFDSIDEKAPFIQFMVETGGMGKTTCYQRFKAFNFKKWEVTGLERLARAFTDFHK